MMCFRSTLVVPLFASIGSPRAPLEACMNQIFYTRFALLATYLAYSSTRMMEAPDSSILWAMMPCNLLEVNQHFRETLIGLFFDPEDGAGMFLQNIGNF